jgi:capsular polysaccharide transport system permease protein
MPTRRAAVSPRARTESLLTVQARVLFALVMREMVTRYGRSPGGYVWAIIEPLATIALLSAVFSAIARHPSLGTNFPIFFATGYGAFHIYKDISASVSSAVQSNRALLAFPRISMLDVILARFLLQTTTSIMAFSAIITGLLLYYDMHMPLDFRAIFAAFAYAALLGIGIGALNCVLFAFSPTYQQVFNIVNRPLFLISGVFFIFEEIPADWQPWLWWNPLIHVTATMRTGFYAEYHAAFVSPVFVLMVALTTLMLGVLLLQVLRGKVLERD